MINDLIKLLLTNYKDVFSVIEFIKNVYDLIELLTKLIKKLCEIYKKKNSNK